MRPVISVTFDKFTSEFIKQRCNYNDSVELEIEDVDDVVDYIIKEEYHSLKERLKYDNETIISLSELKNLQNRLSVFESLEEFFEKKGYSRLQINSFIQDIINNIL